MHNTRFFLHIDPTQTSSLLLAHMKTLSQRNDPLGSAIFEAGNVADAAMAFFRGIFPKEAPYFFWGEGDILPWYPDYDHSGAGDDRQRTALLAEINAIAGELRRLAGPVWLKEPTGQLTYTSPVLCESTQLKVQGLLVETLLGVDGLLNCLGSNRPREALSWQANVYKNLIEALSCANELVHSHESVAAEI